MKISDEIKNNIQTKKIELDNLRIFLKEEFVGIDTIIDGVIDSFTPFYLFPDYLKRPIIVNLWGLTSSGKTALIENLVNFLKLNKQYLKFDIGEYAGGDDKLKKDLASKSSRISQSNNIIVFDEFQLGRTIDSHGNELDKHSLRVVYDILDTGIINSYNTGVRYGLLSLMDKFKKCLELDIQVDDEGFVIKNADIYEKLFRDEYYPSPFDYEKVEIISKDENGKEIITTLDPQSTQKYYNKDSMKFHKPRFFKYDMFSFFYDANSEFFNNLNIFDYHKHLFYTNLTKLYKFTNEDFFDTVSIMEKKDFSKSIIFCLGNLDEVYHMSHNINPDEDADIFHENSLRITLPQVKEALSTRFRMEQIGRLGNTHFIYPALNKHSFETIISKFLLKQRNYFKEEYDIDIIFDKSINNILYAEGIFPTLGVRGLLTTFNSMINSYISIILTDLTIKKPDTTKLEWSYSNNTYHIIAINKKTKISLSYPVECSLEKLRKSDNTELQTLVAIHEAGHALASILKMEICPSEILSKTANLSEGLCKFNYKDIIQNKKFLYHRILVCLGGIVAEEIIFGKDNVSIGSSSDLQKATSLAFTIVKRSGMDKHACLISSITDESMGTSYVKSEDYEKRVLKLIKKAKKEIKECLEENKKYLMILGKELIKKSKLETSEIKEILSELNIDWKDSETYNNYKKFIE